MAYRRTFRPDYYFLTMETMHPKPGKAPSRAQSLAISQATTRRWMSLVPSVHNRISISTAPFAQQPAPTTAGPTEIFLRQPAGTTVTKFYKQNVYDPSDNKIGGVDHWSRRVPRHGRKGCGCSLQLSPRQREEQQLVLVRNTNKEALKTAPGFTYDKAKTTW